MYLSWILLWFEAASGLKINLEKSMVIPVGEVEGVLDMAAEIGCKVGQLPTVYLGLPLGAPNKASSVWDGVEEKMRRKLALWKRQFLSNGGELLSLRARWPAFLCIKCHYSVCLNQWQEDWKSSKGIFCGEGTMGGIRLI